MEYYFVYSMFYQRIFGVLWIWHFVSSVEKKFSW